jgi:hypothetical protein
MPATEREIVLRRIASSVAARYLRGSMVHVAAWNMDMLARLSVLEGAAGVSPGTWLRHKSRGFGMALDHFGPRLAASWTSGTNQGVYDKALATATRVLRNVSGTDAYDLVQNMVAASANPSGPARDRVFYSVGAALRKHENDLSTGDITPRDRKVLGTLDHWVTNQARDVIKSVKEKRTRNFGPQSVSEGYDPLRTRGTAELDDEERANLLLLALQSPGGPGNEVRRIIDREIDRAFSAAQRPIVRAFLSKLGNPKYRSPSQMKKMVTRFSPQKWFTQAYNLIRKEIMDELGVTAQQITNALGGGAKKVFEFMRRRVGQNSRVKRIVEELADEIELYEPVVSRIAKEDEDVESQLEEEQRPTMPHAVVRRWMEEKEKEGNLSSGNAFASLEDGWEKDEIKEWDEQAGPHVQFNRGPSPLRVAAKWAEAREG